MTLFKIFLYGLLFLSLSIYYMSNTLIEEPFMDEIFHFPQAMKYYNGSFHAWDPKITTPPGLYLLSVAVIYPVSRITGLDMGKISCFRLINIIFSTGSFYISYKLLTSFHKGLDERVHLLCAFNVTLLPVLFFFNFLYYTDCGAVFFVLLMYYYHTRKAFFSASVAGAASICFRQTNIVWVFFVAADETVRTLLHICSEDLSPKDHTIHLKSFSDGRRLIQCLLNKDPLMIVWKVLRIAYGYIVIALGFSVFVLWNGSIALGDKTAHQVSPHLPQVLYFLGFTLFFAGPYLFTPAKCRKFLHFVSSHKLLCFELCVQMAAALYFFSYAHPYLLADNRHITFYLWKRLLGRSWMTSFALIPIYLFAGWSLTQALGRQDALFKCLAALCVALCVVPQKLLELRYFIVPFTLLRLHFRPNSKWQPYFEFLLYCVINAITMHLFLFKRLPLASAEKDVRIMW